MNNPKILFIVEGSKTEKQLYKHIASKCGFNANIFSVCGNIHMLYNEMRKTDFMSDIDALLLKLNGVSAKDKEMIKKERPFSLIYLIFDFDPQHYDLSKQENISRGVQDAKEMVDYFNDETDSTIGKLYINYPSIESYRDCKLFKKFWCKRKKISIHKCVKYKYIVGKRGFKDSFRKLNEKQMNYITKINICRGSYIVSNKFIFPDYSFYLSKLSQTAILDSQNKLISKKKKMFILSTCSYFCIDYFGEKFFNSLKTER